MKINSRAKGARGERELAKALRFYGFVNAERGQQHSGSPDSPDIKNAIRGVHIECKRVEKLNLDKAMEQSLRDSGGGIPTVIHRKNNTEWKVTVNLSDLVDLSLLVLDEIDRNAYEESCDPYKVSDVSPALLEDDDAAL
jgi:Holliday junction resolvase